MLNTILFDLDGTLLPLDFDKFVKIYFSEMGLKFMDLIEPKKLAASVLAATEVMVKNTEMRTNEVIFMEKFATLIDGDLAEYQRRFLEYYDEGFAKARDAIMDLPLIRDSVNLLKEKGYNLVVATNPLFPEKAILHRICWAGLEPADFSYITSYEKNHFCKPQVQFYEEVLREIGKQPAECLMVGNDVQEDMVAGVLGIKTYLITDCLIHRGSDAPNATYSGTYQDFHEYVAGLESLR